MYEGNLVGIITVSISYNLRHRVDKNDTVQHHHLLDEYLHITDTSVVNYATTQAFRRIQRWSL